VTTLHKKWTPLDRTTCWIGVGVGAFFLYLGGGMPIVWLIGVVCCAHDLLFCEDKKERDKS